MRIAIFGAGAVGGYFGGRLAEAGQDVVMIARGDHLQAMQENGLRVQSIEGDFVIQRVQASDNPTAVGVVDAILVTVKAWQVPRAAVAMRPMVGPDTFVVPLENGVEAPGQLSDALGDKHVLGGLCKIISTLTAPGFIRHAGISPIIAFGELDGQHTRRVDRLGQAFEAARGVTVQIPSDIQAAIWEKFLFIASFSGLGALTRAPVGVLRSLPETRGMLREALAEVLTLAQAHGIALTQTAVAKTMAFIDSLPPDGTASMQRDVMEGRPSELEAQNGAVVRLAQQSGVDVPLHSVIYRSLRPQELRARGDIEFD